MSQPLGYALVGAGSFGNFCVGQYRKLDVIKPIGVFDANHTFAQTMARTFSMKAYTSMDELLHDTHVTVVHLATPPYTHAELAMQCLEAGKHVLCEKPLATDIGDGVRLIDASRDAERLLAVNLIMRYDPLNRIVKRIIEEKLLGEVIAGSLMNLATDYKLGPDHWFWDPVQSGGIFVEHGVHFFDLFEMWLGPATVCSAQIGFRPGTDRKIAEQARCVTEHGDGVLIDHYHGFHQAQPMDRQELRLICERGDILLRGWLSESIEIDALLDEPRVNQLRALLGDLSVSVSSTAPDVSPPYKARHQQWNAAGRFRIRALLPMQKPDLYGQCIRDLMSDQIAWVHDRSHSRAVSEANGLRSLEVAHQATRMARASEEIVA